MPEPVSRTDKRGAEVVVAPAVVLVLSVAGFTVLWPSDAGVRGPEVLDGAMAGDLLASHGYRMIRVLPGSFLQGSAPNDGLRMVDEVLREVQLTQSFTLGATEVSQSLWLSLMGSDPSSRPCEGCPVHDVRWTEAVAFCNRLSERAGLDAAYDLSGDEPVWRPRADGYRLPTEAEWEYAAGAGVGGLYAGGDEPERVAWYSANTDGSPMPSARLRPNAWGFYDMSGNVWEWVWDRYGERSGQPAVNPSGPGAGEMRVGKGGAWNTWSDMIRIATRSRGHASSRGDVIGFRLARTVD